MSDAYLLSPPEDHREASRYSVGGTAPFSIGRLICPDCGEHASAAFEYPGFDVTRFGEDITRYLWRHNPGAPFRDSYQGPAELTLEQMRDLSALLAPILGPARPFGPFTEFGPLQGRAEGMFSDFTWPSINSPPFLRRSAFDILQAAGFGLTGVPSKLEYRREREDPLVVLEVPPTARMHVSLRPKPCDMCGFAARQRKGVRLDAATFDGSIAIQCIFERPHTVVVNAALADFISERKLTGAKLTAVPAE